jgi:hypothetical protein
MSNLSTTHSEPPDDAHRFGNLVLGKGADLTRQRADLLGRFPAHLRREAERILNAAGLEQNDLYVDLVALAAAIISRMEQVQKCSALIIASTSMVLSVMGLLLGLFAAVADRTS